MRLSADCPAAAAVPALHAPRRCSRTGPANSYFSKDALGSVVGIFDNQGTFRGGYSYSPYGETRSVGTDASVVTNPLRYISGYLDSASGMYKLGARYFDPAQGRFTQFDPSGQERNPYAYAGCNPVNAKDPTGLVSQCFISVVAGVFGVAGTVSAFTGGAAAVLAAPVTGGASFVVAFAAAAYFGISVALAVYGITTALKECF